MAEGGETSTDTQSIPDSGHSDEETTCPVCLKVFKHPKLLPCFHTFCADCIRQLLDGDVAKCPLCQNTCTQIEIDRLPHNFSIEAKIKSKRDKEPSCDTCEENPPLKKFCYDCEQYLCPNCFRMHQAFRAMQTHRVYDVSPVAPEANQTAQYSYCAKHEDEVLVLFCKLCNACICRNCKLTNHERHDTVNLEGYRKESAKQIKGKIEALQREEEFMENQKLAVNEYSKVMENLMATSKDKVESMRKELHATVNNECDALNLGIHEKTTQHKIQLAEYNADISTRMLSFARKKNDSKFDLIHGLTTDTGESSINLLMKKEKRVEKKEFRRMKVSFPQITPLHVAVADLKCHLDDVLTWNHLYVGHVSADLISNFSVHNTSTMHISKLQVTESYKCYIHLKRDPVLTVPMNLAHNVLCCNESGQVIECSREHGLKDMTLSRWYLYKIFCDSQFKLEAERSKKEGSKQKDHGYVDIKEQHLIEPECVCSFINIYGQIASLNQSGQVIGDEKIKFSRQAMHIQLSCLLNSLFT